MERLAIRERLIDAGTTTEKRTPLAKGDFSYVAVVHRGQR